MCTGLCVLDLLNAAGALLNMLGHVLTMIEHEHHSALRLCDDRLLSAIDFFMIPTSADGVAKDGEEERQWFVAAVANPAVAEKPFFKIILRFKETYLHMKRRDLSVSDLSVFAATLGTEYPLSPDAACKLFARMRVLEGIASVEDLKPAQNVVDAHRAAVASELDRLLIVEQDTAGAQRYFDRHRVSLDQDFGESCKVTIDLAVAVQTCRGVRMEFPKWEEPDAVWKAFVLSKSAVDGFIELQGSLDESKKITSERKLHAWKDKVAEARRLSSHVICSTQLVTCISIALSASTPVQHRRIACYVFIGFLLPVRWWAVACVSIIVTRNLTHFCLIIIQVPCADSVWAARAFHIDT